MIASTPWYLLVPLSLGLAACTESRTPASASAAAPAKSMAAQLAPEPTFESIPDPKELVELLRKNLRDPVDTEEEHQALNEVQGSLDKFTYVRPDTLIGVDPNVEGPMGDSFIADSEWAAKRVQERYGANMQVSCLTRPCIHYGDFDGDGKRDLVVQVADNDKSKSGLAFLLADETHALLAAGRESPIGDDLLPWMDTWQVVPHSSDKGSAVMLASSTQKARVELSLKPGADGAHEVIASWNCTPTRQVPLMDGPTGPEGFVTSSGVTDPSGESAAWHAFDDKDSTLWSSDTKTTEPVWIGYEWKEGARYVTRYALTFNDDMRSSRAPRDFTLQGWDGESWVTVDSRTGEIKWEGRETRQYTVSRPGAYRAYRLHITEDNDSGEAIVAISLDRIELLGGNCGGDEK